jgi:hypothetical protein
LTFAAPYFVGDAQPLRINKRKHPAKIKLFATMISVFFIKATLV